jgi:hypothetical protein
MLRLTLILTLGLQTLGFGQTFMGQVFLLSEDYEESKCEAFGECDCCTSDVFFMTADKFYYVSRCISGDAYFTGTYSTKSNKLKLTFDKKFVREVTDSEYNVTGLETKTTDIKPTEFDVAKCGQKVRLIHPTTREWRNGSRYDKVTETTLMKELTTSKALKQLLK